MRSLSVSVRIACIQFVFARTKIFCVNNEMNHNSKTKPNGIVPHACKFNASLFDCN